MAGIILATCAAAAVRQASHRQPVDPCEADPGAYACAMFAQPEWLKRRVYAGRLETQPAVSRPPVGVEAVAVAAEAPEPTVNGI